MVKLKGFSEEKPFSPFSLQSLSVQFLAKRRQEDIIILCISDRKTQIAPA